MKKQFNKYLKSVEELLPIMGESYKDLSVQVAYKEGYNKAVKDLFISLQKENK